MRLFHVHPFAPFLPPNPNPPPSLPLWFAAPHAPTRAAPDTLAAERRSLSSARARLFWVRGHLVFHGGAIWYTSFCFRLHLRDWLCSSFEFARASWRHLRRRSAIIRSVNNPPALATDEPISSTQHSLCQLKQESRRTERIYTDMPPAAAEAQGCNRQAARGRRADAPPDQLERCCSSFENSFRPSSSASSGGACALSWACRLGWCAGVCKRARGFQRPSSDNSRIPPPSSAAALDPKSEEQTNPRLTSTTFLTSGM